MHRTLNSTFICLISKKLDVTMLDVSPTYPLHRKNLKMIFVHEGRISFQGFLEQEKSCKGLPSEHFVSELVGFKEHPEERIPQASLENLNLYIFLLQKTMTI